MTLEELFNTKTTENGDTAFIKPSENNLLNILFSTEYYQKHLSEIPFLDSRDINQLFAMFIRDPRFGLGKRDLGRRLMSMTKVPTKSVIKAGRIDDVFFLEYDDFCDYLLVLEYLKEEIEKGNELVKKWMPRYSSKNQSTAREIAKYWNMNKQQYGHFIKCNTVENKLSRHNYDDIDFEHIPSLAMLKYAKAFSRKSELSKRYAQYLIDVKEGKKKLNISTTTVYDIYKHMREIDADVFFSKIKKISGSWIPIVDSSGSMHDNNDSYGKAMSIGHYLAKCSTYCPNKIVSFSSYPQLITLGEFISNNIPWGRCMQEESKDYKSVYEKEIASMYTGDCTNTNFGAVMSLLANLGGDNVNLPEYLIVLSDMEFDAGSSKSKDETMRLFKEEGYPTRIVWWNLNSRNLTAPETDKYGNILISGYNPMLLRFLEAGFDGNKFLYKLLEEYQKYIQES